MSRFNFAAALAVFSFTLPVLAAPASEPSANPYPSTYRAPASQSTLIRNATILDGAGARIDDADLLMVDGKVKALGRGLPTDGVAVIVDAKGRWVTPGIIDVHSHLGVYPAPRT